MDSLFKYKMNDEEKERVLMMVLKRVSHTRFLPKFYIRCRNLKTWKWIDETFGEKCSQDVIRTLDELGMLQSDGVGKPYRVSKRGQECLKRGYILHYKDRTAKNANIIAICALIVAALALIWNVIRDVFL